MFNIERNGEELRQLSYKDSKCVGCGICSDVCPTSSLRLGPLVPIARGLIEMDLISVNEDSCVFCGLCSVACPFDALSLSINGENIKKIDSYPKWETESEVDDDYNYISNWDDNYFTEISLSDMVDAYEVQISPLIIGEIYIAGLGIVLISILIPSLMIMRYNPKRILMSAQ